MRLMSSIVEHTCGALGNTYECCTSFGNMTTISTGMDRLPCLNIRDDGSTTRNLVICNQSLCNWLSFVNILVMFATNMQLNVYNVDTCHKNNGLNLYIFKYYT
jgi:hypothetical protein